MRRRVSQGSATALTVLLTVAGVALWSWPLPRQLSTHALEVTASPVHRNEAGWDLILENDQNLSIWGAASNARALAAGDPAALIHQGQCYPAPRAASLGEHMIELGILALPWWMLSGDPLVAYNLALLASMILGAVGMLLFLQRHTESWAASIAGAMAFTFATPHLQDLAVHPAVVGVHWIPWMLWAFDGILDGRGPGATLAFATSLVLAVLVGSYPLLTAALVGLGYALVRLAAAWSELDRPWSSLARLATAALPAVLLALAILVLYGRVQEEWGLVTMSGAKYVAMPGDLLPGGAFSLGLFAIGGLALLVVLPRRDGAGVAGVAGVPGVVGGLVAAALATLALSLRLPLVATPEGGWSLYEAAARQLAFLDTIRAPGKVALGACLALQALAAIGWSRAARRLAPGGATVLGAFALVLVAVDVAPPTWLRGLVGPGVATAPRRVAPAAASIAAMKAVLSDGPHGAVLDLPVGRMARSPVALVDAAYHGLATSACYNSLVPPTMRAAYALAAGARSARGQRELAGAGFRYVIERPSRPSQRLSSSSFQAPARLLAFEQGMAVWQLPDAPPSHHDLSLLEIAPLGGATRAGAFAPEPPHEIDVEVTNRGSTMWVAPRPLEPFFADVELSKPGDAAGAEARVVHRWRVRGVLPLALAAGESTIMQMVSPSGADPGLYRAVIRMDASGRTVTLPRFSWSAPTP